MRDELTDSDFEQYELDDYEEDEEEFLDCAMDRHGACGKAGSEECDFECPYRAEQIARENRRRASHP
jgi:hypothetical protein